MRLISGGELTQLYVFNNNQPLLDQPAAALIADALRANSTLTSLKLHACRFWHDAAVATLVLGALTAHRTLRTLDLSDDGILQGDQQAPALGAALGALVAADAKALHELHLSSFARYEVGLLALGPLLDALALNTHLHTLNLDHNRCTIEFARDRLLPAVCRNKSLRRLNAGDVVEWGAHRFIREAEALVAGRLRCAASAAP